MISSKGTQMEHFSFDTAFRHFLNGKGPKGFMWKYILAYTVVLGVGYIAFFALFFSGMTEQITNLIELEESGREPELQDVFGFILPFLLTIPLTMAFTLAFMSVFESMAQRFYIRGEGLGLRLGADELRVAAVYCIWAAIWLALTLLVLGVSVALIAPTLIEALNAPSSAPPDINPGPILLMFPVTIIVSLVACFIGVRLSPAAAMTIRDRKIRFFSAWGATKGRFWPMVGAFLVIYMIGYAIMMGVQIVAMPIMMGMIMSQGESFVGMTEPDPEALFSAISPAIFIMFGVMSLFGAVSSAFMQYGFAGVTSKAALTDPNWDQRGMESANIFD